MTENKNLNLDLSKLENNFQQTTTKNLAEGKDYVYGTYNGQSLPDGTYYYIFKYHDGINEDKTGFIVIQR